MSRFFLFAWLWLVSSKLMASVVGLPDWLPWGELRDDGSKRGYFVEVARLFIPVADRKTELKLVPGNRLVRGYALREWDWGVFFCEPVPEKYLSAGRLITLKQVLVVRHDSPLRDEAELQNATVVKARIALAKPLPIETRPSLNIVTADSAIEALRVVLAHHADAAFVSEQVIAWLQRNNRTTMNGLRALPLPGSERDVCLMMARDLDPGIQQRLQSLLAQEATRERITTLDTLYFGPAIRERTQ